MEATIIRALNFDFGFLSPLPFLERYLRILDFLYNPGVVPRTDSERLQYPSVMLHPYAVDLIKYVHSKGDLLWSQPPSIIAASVIIVAQRLLSSQSNMPKWLCINPLWTFYMTEVTGIKLDELTSTGFLNVVEQ